MQRQKSQEKIKKPDPKGCDLKLKMRLGDSISIFTLKISDYYTDKDRYSREKPDQIEKVDG